MEGFSCNAVQQRVLGERASEKQCVFDQVNDDMVVGSCSRIVEYENCVRSRDGRRKHSAVERDVFRVRARQGFHYKQFRRGQAGRNHEKEDKKAAFSFRTSR